MIPKVNLDDPIKDWRNRAIHLNFSEDYPIFFGPGQVTVYPDGYMNPIGWRDLSVLTPPVVIRGFTGGKNVSPPIPPPPPGGSLCGPGKPRYHYLGSRQVTYGSYFSSMWSGDDPCCRQSTIGGYLYRHDFNPASGTFNVSGVPLTAIQVMALAGIHNMGTYTSGSESPYNEQKLGIVGQTTTSYTCTTYSGLHNCTLSFAVWAVDTGIQLPFPATIPSIPDDGHGNAIQGQELYFKFSVGDYVKYWHFFYDCAGTFSPVCYKVTLDTSIPEGCDA